MGNDNETIWYWQYRLKIFDCLSNQEIEAAGIVAAPSLVDAAKAIEKYYGDDIIDVKALKPIVSDIFDFEAAENEDLFDYRIKKKNKKR